MRALLFATIATLSLVGHAHAQLVDKTPCSVFIASLGPDDAPNMDGYKAAKAYFPDLFAKLDSQHTENGEVGILSELSDKGMTNMVAMASVTCRVHPKMTVYNSAAFVYRGSRELQMALGIAK